MYIECLSKIDKNINSVVLVQYRVNSPSLSCDFFFLEPPFSFAKFQF